MSLSKFTKWITGNKQKTTKINKLPDSPPQQPPRPDHKQPDTGPDKKYRIRKKEIEKYLARRKLEKEVEQGMHNLTSKYHTLRKK